MFLDWIQGSVMDSGKCFVPMDHRTNFVSPCCVPQGQLTQTEASSSMSEVFEVLGLIFPHTRTYHANAQDFGVGAYSVTQRTLNLSIAN